MKWFDKWFKNKCREAWDSAKVETQANVPMAIGLGRNGPSSFEATGMNLTVYKANGGYIIEHRIYDRNTDRSNNSLHIITDNKDLGEEIGKIITYENLRN